MDSPDKPKTDEKPIDIDKLIENSRQRKREQQDYIDTHFDKYTKQWV